MGHMGRIGAAKDQAPERDASFKHVPAGIKAFGLQGQSRGVCDTKMSVFAPTTLPEQELGSAMGTCLSPVLLTCFFPTPAPLKLY